LNIENTRLKKPLLNKYDIFNTTCSNSDPVKLKKINKIIEIVTVPKSHNANIGHGNIVINFDEEKIFDILAKHYHYVTIMVINTQKDLDELVSKQPDLIFSNVKYFTFKMSKIWLNDFLDLHNISHVSIDKYSLNPEASYEETILKIVANGLTA